MAGEFSINFNRSMVIGGKTIGGIDNTIVADMEVILEKTVPALSTNAEFDLAVTIANVQCMGIHADQDCSVFVNAPSTGSPLVTLVLKKNQPLLWNNSSDPAGFKFITGNITALYVTAGSNATNIVFGAGVDSTPVLSP